MNLKRKIWLWLGVLVGLILATDLSVSYSKLTGELRAETEYDARTVYGLMMATRRIYQQQFIDSGLAVTAETVGFLPAHAVSRIAKDFANWNDSGVIFNNISDVPRNPANQADPDELAAIAWFRANPKSVERMENVVDAKGNGYLLYTAPIWVEPLCLKCHGDPADAPSGIRETYSTAYGYKLGDLRGVASIKIPTRKFDARFRAIWGGQVAKSVAGYLILFIAIGVLLDRLVSRRLTNLHAAAERIAAGEYATRVRVLGKDEIGQLASTFNHMAEAVEAQEAALKNELAEKQIAQAEINRLAYYDRLTNLPNRALLMDRLGLALAVAQRQGHIDALVLFNLDRFKILNDAHGHRMGDLLLVAVGGRLAALLREGDTLARLASDEFAILLQDIDAQREAASRRAITVAEKIHACMRLPFVLEPDKEMILTASLGITLSPESDADSPQEILRRADTALHRAKDAGGNRTAFFEDDMGLVARRRFTVERELRRAIPAGELRLYLQPQVAADRSVVGAEALVRWQHSERGLLPPSEFIGVAEESDLIVDLGAWVLSEACALIADADIPLRLSVNISPRQFRQPGFVAWVTDLLAVSKADPSRLTLEITEGMVIDSVDALVAKMHELTRLGLRFSIDDFGTGYSSLAYIKRMPIHELKIDRSFVQDAPSNPNDAALVETILSVARHMDLQVVAEGVETESQAAFLNAQPGTIVHQGYLYGRPAPATEWIARWQAPPGGTA